MPQSTKTLLPIPAHDYEILMEWSREVEATASSAHVLLIFLLETLEDAGRPEALKQAVDISTFMLDAILDRHIDLLQRIGRNQQHAIERTFKPVEARRN